MPKARHVVLSGVEWSSDSPPWIVRRAPVHRSTLLATSTVSMGRLVLRRAASSRLAAHLLDARALAARTSHRVLSHACVYLTRSFISRARLTVLSLARSRRMRPSLWRARVPRTVYLTRSLISRARPPSPPCLIDPACLPPALCSRPPRSASHQQVRRALWGPPGRASCSAVNGVLPRHANSGQ